MAASSSVSSGRPGRGSGMEGRVSDRAVDPGRGPGRKKRVPPELVRRVRKELMEITLDPPANCSATPKGGNLLEWSARIAGPEGTPYEGGVYDLEIKFGLEYPFKPPHVRFSTRIYHCNISPAGEICVDILKDQWSPALTIAKVLMSIISLLNEPNPQDPLDADAAKLFKSDLESYLAKARAVTVKHALTG